jgi:hypothetical protein
VKRGLLSRLGLLRRLGRREKAPSTSTGSLTRRMIGVAAVWILILLGVGGYTLDRVLVNAPSPATSTRGWNMCSPR